MKGAFAFLGDYLENHFQQLHRRLRPQGIGLSDGMLKGFSSLGWEFRGFFLGADAGIAPV